MIFMNNKTAPLVIIIVTILVIIAVLWLVLWQSVRPINQNTNQANSNQTVEGTINFELDKEFWMKKDQTGRLRAEDLGIKLTGITYSPCPEGVMCVWSGLGANIEVNKGTESKELSLVLSGTVTVFRFEINLFQVQQDKVSFIVKKTQQLTVSTNKIIYQKGEEVKITIDNNSSDDVVIRSPYYEIRSAGSKDEKNKIQIVRCPCGMVCEALAPFLTLKKGEKLEYTWNQANQRCEGDNQINEQVAVGSYRVDSYLENDKEWQDFIYADFTIREKSAEVTITTDKTEYQKGEKVIVTIANNLSDSIWYTLDCGEEPFDVYYANIGQWQQVHSYTKTLCEVKRWLRELKPQTPFEYNYGQLTSQLFEKAGKYKIQFRYTTTKPADIDNQDDWTLAESNEFTIKEQVVCGGFGGIKCPEGYYCYIEPENQIVADAMGVCKPKDKNSCQTDANCVLIQMSCCPCSSGGTVACVNKEFKDELKAKDCDKKDIMCPTVLPTVDLCDIQPSQCVCYNGQCEGISVSPANVNK